MAKLQYAAVLVWAATAAISHLACRAQDTGGGGTAEADDASAVCRPSSCGDVLNISTPFRLRGDDRRDCGDRPYELECVANRTILVLNDRLYFWVKAIWYEKMRIQVIDSRAITDGPSFLLSPGAGSEFFNMDDPRRFHDYFSAAIQLINCSARVEGRDDLVEASSCMTTTSSRSREAAAAAAAGSGTYLYWYLNGRWDRISGQFESSGLPRGCRRVGTFPYGSYSSTRMWLASCSDVRDALMQGFSLTWNVEEPWLTGRCQSVCPDDSSDVTPSIRCFFCSIWYGYIELWMDFYYLSYPYKYKWDDYFYSLGCMTRLLIIGCTVRTSIGYIALLAFLVYKLRRRLLGMHDDVEMFLAEYRNCMPTRYTYRQIKKMTGNFKEKLGHGGFGSVFRGKQLTGRLVAIKILSKSDSNGQDFINEVATIGRIHHANVVQLVGFCVEGSKKALVYEFMPQGSLDKYIYENKEGASTSTNSTSSSTSPPLNWAKTLEVAIGIARGIEYLHRGCSMKILHFDIKPQNVLLDTNFNPKVSDFGLAKSYPTEKNTVTVTAVRGTFGYMAPELFYASAGRVSSKSDVYSFGMLLMEMAGRRKNVHPDHAGSISNECYLPTWIYHQLEQGKDIAVGGSNDEEKNIIYKMFMVALWCVQMKPVDRPSMGKVIEMLEGSAQQLQMPTGKPFLCSTDLVNFDDLVTTGSDSSEVSIVLPPHASA